LKIAIIGSGIAGNTIAYYLHKKHDITVFESESHVGGHTHTHHIRHEGQDIAVDTGFIVFNDRTYPHFIALLKELNVDWRPSSMSFSVRCEDTGLEYNGATLNSLFAQRLNLFRPSFHKMIRDILRFNKCSLALLSDGSEIKLGDYLKFGGYSQQFIDYYIIPMGSAIWSTDAKQMLDFPARFFVRFFHNHGMLSIDDRPEWRTITDGSASYVAELTRPFIKSIRLNTPIKSVRRLKNSVRIKPKHGLEEKFDYVFFACHSDQALNILSDPTQVESEVLGAIPYQSNTIYLHHDQTLMPKKKLAWAAWNYHVTTPAPERVAVTYDMNILQGIESEEHLLVTLNHTKGIDPKKVIKRIEYMHPVYTLEGASAQAKHANISGVNRTGFAGAYWRNGFHEDGVVSALEAIKHFERFCHGI
jgi:predicted NAD/FAD-binding protein